MTRRKQADKPIFNEDTLEGSMANILWDIFGKECFDDTVEKTASRLIRAFKEFSPKDEIPFGFTVFPTHINQLVVVRDIEFSSLCAHHLFPFVGRAHVGYIPNKLQVGLSKIPRLVHHFATRPQTQERLTEQIADYLKDQLQAHGVMVVIEAQHTCMSARGIREHNGMMSTSATKGIFLTAAEAREEFLALAGLKR
jgi:GTP cyclohydrolase I